MEPANANCSVDRHWNGKARSTSVSVNMEVSVLAHDEFREAL